MKKTDETEEEVDEKINCCGTVRLNRKGTS
jgi:hypothetical protein